MIAIPAVGSFEIGDHFGRGGRYLFTRASARPATPVGQLSPSLSKDCFSDRSRASSRSRQQRLYLRPLPHGQESFRRTHGVSASGGTNLRRESMILFSTFDKPPNGLNASTIYSNEHCTRRTQSIAQVGYRLGVIGVGQDFRCERSVRCIHAPGSSGSVNFLEYRKDKGRRKGDTKRILISICR